MVTTPTDAHPAKQSRPPINRTIRLSPRTGEQQRRAKAGVTRRGSVHSILNQSSNQGGIPAQSNPVGYVTDNGQSVGLYAVAGDANAGDSASDQGGPTIDGANLQLIFWGSAWQTANSPSSSDVTNAVRNVLGTTYLASMVQYGYQHINLSNTLTVLNDPPSNFSFDDVGNLVWDLIDQGTFPEPDEPGGRNLYMLFVPGTVNYNDPNVRGAHGDPSDYDFPSYDYAWAGWVGYGSINYITDVFTHELVESISDPEPHNSAWLMGRNLNGGNEIGDACNNTADYLDGLLVQAYWSQAQHACVIPFMPPPVVTSLLPSAGVPDGGGSIRISGANFDTNGSTRVFFGSREATGVTCPSPSQCDVTSPPGTGTVDVTVRVNHFTSAIGTSDQFSYVPSVTGLSPASGTIGDTITIHGLGFSWTPGSTSISFGPYPATTFSCYPGPDCTAIVPSGGGTVDVRVTVFGTTTGLTAADQFTYSGPSITSVTPSQGPLTGGTLVDILGSGFDRNAPTGNNMQVYFNGVQSSYVLCITDGWCSVLSPAVANPGQVHVTATVFGAHGSPSPSDLFTYTASPVLTKFSADPASPPVGQVGLDGYAPAGGTVVLLSSSDPGVVPVPASVTVPAGTDGASFPLVILPTPNAETVTLTASYAGTSLSTTVSVTASSAISLDLGTDRLGPGVSSTATVTLNTPAPAGGAVVALSSNDQAAVPVPVSVTIPAGSFTTTFVITDFYSGYNKQVTITAAYGGSSARAWLSVPGTCAPLRCPPSYCGVLQDDCGNQLCCGRHPQCCS